MKYFKKRIINIAIIICITFLISGCATLTKSQIDAVSKFGKITENYGTTPSKAIDAYAELQLYTSAAEVSTMQDEEAVLNHIDESLETYDDIVKRSKKAGKSFKVLSLYSKLLIQLTDDKYTKSLDSDSKKIADSLDSAIESYNSYYDTEIDSFGGTAAAIIRGVGGLYIRSKQSEAIKKLVKDADPAIEEMTTAIVDISGIIAYGVEKELSTLRAELEATAKYAPKSKNKKKFMPDLASYVHAMELLHKGNNAAKTAKSAKSTATSYRKAHKELVKNTRNKIEGIDDLIETIKALKKEIDAGMKLM
jgi:hypothetical protein